MKVQLRFNTNFPKTSDKKWRILINDVQHLVDEIDIDRPCFTSEDIVKGDDGNDIVKYHISINNVKDVVFNTTKENKLIATIF
jgi:hypothetical protein